MLCDRTNTYSVYKCYINGVVTYEISLKVLVCSSLIVSGLFSTAQAATWGAEVGVSSISPCPSFCGGLGGMFDFAFDGGEFSSTAFTTLNNTDGDGQASANLSGPNTLPVLGAEGFSRTHFFVSIHQKSYDLQLGIERNFSI